MAKTPPHPTLTYRVADVAEMLGLSRNKIYRLVYAGELKAVKVSPVRNGPLLITKKSLDAWLAANAWASVS